MLSAIFEETSLCAWQHVMDLVQLYGKQEDRYHFSPFACKEGFCLLLYFWELAWFHFFSLECWAPLLSNTLKVTIILELLLLLLHDVWDDRKVPLQNCIDDDTEGMTTTTVLEENMDWKIRLLNPPRRLWQTVPALGITAAIKEVYLADFNYWVYITDFYVHHFGPRRILEIRNVLDMNAMYGG